MNPFDLPPEVGKAAPGVLGALASLRWLPGSLWAKGWMLLAGSFLSYFGAAWVARFSGLDAGFAGFLLGLLGMAVVDKIVEVWKQSDIGPTFRDWLRKAAGLPPKPSGTTKPADLSEKG